MAKPIIYTDVYININIIGTFGHKSLLFINFNGKDMQQTFANEKSVFANSTMFGTKLPLKLYSFKFENNISFFL